ncbi:MAG: cytochrome c oxidase assembly factor Coa1 family protein [Planctomycetota bacterium]
MSAMCSMELDTAPHLKKRRRIWIVIILAAIATPLFLGAAVLVLTYFMATSSIVQAEAVEKAKSEERVTTALGTPIKEGFIWSGTLEVNGPSGSADLAIPISGPNGAGTIYVKAKKVAGIWEYSILEVAIERAGERINLLPAAGDQ